MEVQSFESFWKKLTFWTKNIKVQPTFFCPTPFHIEKTTASRDAAHSEKPKNEVLDDFLLGFIEDLLEISQLGGWWDSTQMFLKRVSAHLFKTRF